MCAAVDDTKQCICKAKGFLMTKYSLSGLSDNTKSTHSKVYGYDCDLCQSTKDIVSGHGNKVNFKHSVEQGQPKSNRFKRTLFLGSSLEKLDLTR